jgi:hypothetical protein
MFTPIEDIFSIHVLTHSWTMFTPIEDILSIHVLTL